MRVELDAALPERSTCIILPGAVRSPSASALLEKIGHAKWDVIHVLEQPGEALPGAIAIIGQPPRVFRLFLLLGCLRKKH